MYSPDNEAFIIERTMKIGLFLFKKLYFSSFISHNINVTKIWGGLIVRRPKYAFLMINCFITNEAYSMKAYTKQRHLYFLLVFKELGLEKNNLANRQKNCTPQYKVLSCKVFQFETTMMCFALRDDIIQLSIYVVREMRIDVPYPM